MHSSASGMIDRIVSRSLPNAARFSVLKGERYASMVLGLANISGVLLLVLMPEASGWILALEAPLRIASSEWAFCAAPPRPHRPPARQAWPYPGSRSVDLAEIALSLHSSAPPRTTRQT
jgi:hypothetical protein